MQHRISEQLTPTPVRKLIKVLVGFVKQICSRFLSYCIHCR